MDRATLVAGLGSRFHAHRAKSSSARWRGCFQASWRKQRVLDEAPAPVLTR